MIIVNGYGTYSKTPFKGSKHPRAKGGSFKPKGTTEEGSVSWHHSFKKSQHKRSSDGSFANGLSNGAQLGLARYGSKR